MIWNMIISHNKKDENIETDESEWEKSKNRSFHKY